ncbi:MAG: hypothetical protein RI973_1099 [Bacteroidota bacterium]|jgi:protoporphyrinogen oxidase
MHSENKIVIIGAGPAGLTAAYELAKTGKYQITVLDRDTQVGGISKTVNHKGNLIDMGGHRFFSKSERVLKWWADFLPIVDTTHQIEIFYHHKKTGIDDILMKQARNAMLVRPRKSRIYFKRKMFDYPLKVNVQLFKNLGLLWSLQVARDVFRARLFPIRPENTLEHFYINRFGRTLYETFFKDYTHKVWGKPCSEISSEWGRQRVKSLGIREILWHSLKNAFAAPGRKKDSSRTLTEKFLYPAKGPGMMWEVVQQQCEALGVRFEMMAEVRSLSTDKDKVTFVSYEQNGTLKSIACDAAFSTMALNELVASLECPQPEKVRRVAAELEYRDFLIVGLLLKKLSFEDPGRVPLKDNWLYIQEKDVKVGRLQIFNNWSPFMVEGNGTWIGAEYFCSHGDCISSQKDEDLIRLAVKELHQIGILDPEQFEEGRVVRCSKAYPSYTGSYNEIEVIKEFLSGFENLYPMGRNGLHKYNNQDHSMLTAFKAVELFEQGIASKEEIWAINTEEEYHEEVSTKEAQASAAVQRQGELQSEPVPLHANVRKLRRRNSAAYFLRRALGLH